MLIGSLLTVEKVFICHKILIACNCTPKKRHVLSQIDYLFPVICFTIWSEQTTEIIINYNVNANVNHWRCHTAIRFILQYLNPHLFREDWISYCKQHKKELIFFFEHIVSVISLPAFWLILWRKELPRKQSGTYVTCWKWKCYFSLWNCSSDCQCTSEINNWLIHLFSSSFILKCFLKGKEIQWIHKIQECDK